SKVLVVTFLLLFPAFASAAHINLAWSPNSEPDLGGYIIYYGTSPGNYTDLIDVGNTTSYRIKGLPANQEYFIALTAYDIYGNESGFSAEVSGDAAPGDDPAPTDPTGLPTADFSSGGGGCFIAKASSIWSGN
ncbi:MAG: hypothetical protein GTO24_27080, partial [candidate division Zixibacteria bacterium]|nr:hypothetical protein [candidate division Zixibacteria bacterium]